MSRAMSERQKLWFTKGYITVKMAAEKTGWSEDTVCRMVNNRKLEAKFDAGTRFVSIASLEECLKLPADAHDPHKAGRPTDRQLDFRAEIRQVGQVPRPRPRLNQIPESLGSHTTMQQRRGQLAEGRIGVRHAATITKRHHSTIYRAITAGKLETVQVKEATHEAGEVFVTLESLIKWVGKDAAKEFGLVKR